MAFLRSLSELCNWYLSPSTHASAEGSIVSLFSNTKNYGSNIHENYTLKMFQELCFFFELESGFTNQSNTLI